MVAMGGMISQRWQSWCIRGDVIVVAKGGVTVVAMGGLTVVSRGVVTGVVSGDQSRCHHIGQGLCHK